MADTHCSFALLKALCSAISPPSSNYWDWKTKYFQYSLELAATKKHSLAQGTKKNMLQERVDTPHLQHLFLSKVLERYFGFLRNYRYVVDSFYLFSSSLCLEHEHVRTGSTAAILLLWDKRVWQGIAKSKNRLGVFDFSESLLSSGLFTLSLFVVKPYLFCYCSSGILFTASKQSSNWYRGRKSPVEIWTFSPLSFRLA